ncbi:ancient ubiquitous protein 1-like isoform X2 [Dendronephthya gigantea]|nr:ancient ubiquitous protein 1-like isoform X2 [Dendronephthya gigantea]
MVIRIFFAIQLYFVLILVPKSWVIRRILLRVSGALTGLIVTQEGLDTVHANQCKMIISNHICHVDSLAFESLLSCFMNIEKNRIPTFLRWILKYDEVKPGDPVPSLVFAEGASTNGNSGILRFSSWPFDIKNEPFFVAILTISRPYFVQIAPSVLGGNWWSDFLWLLFTPYTHFRIRFVRAPEREEKLSNEEYSSVVQKFMASKLGINATKFDAKEKVEYAKRYLHEQGRQSRERPSRRSATSSNSSSTKQTTAVDDTLDIMLTQVKDVLPQVPITVIRNDIKKTRCIDTTISNILEGRVVYTPEIPGQKIEENAQPKNNPSNSKVAGNMFGKDSAERHLSFQEKKKAFIEAARQKYIAKHNLDVR